MQVVESFIDDEVFLGSDVRGRSKSCQMYIEESTG